MDRRLAWVAGVFLAAAAWQGRLSAEEPSREGENPSESAFRLEPDGSLKYNRQDPVTGQFVLHVLSPQQALPVRRLLEGKSPEEGDRALADALMSYFLPAEGKDVRLAKLLFVADSEGRLKLTPAGRNTILDILTAQEGTQFVPFDWGLLPKRTGGFSRWPFAPYGARSRERSVGEDIRPAQRGGARLSESGSRALDLATRFSFDGNSHAKGAEPGGVGVKLRSYAWGSLDEAGFPKSRALKKYKLDPEKGTLRIMINTDQRVRRDRFLVRRPSRQAGAVYRETGLDASLLERHGATLVRAVDNIVTVDVPLERVLRLGRELKAQGISSRPARVFRAAWDAARKSLPIPLVAAHTTPESGRDGGFEPQNAKGASLLKAEGLWSQGMEGEGAVVGIIDTGLDVSHPDFQGKLLKFVDLTGEGEGDGIGHGTHVSGSAVGTGASSGGLFKGMAPKAGLVMFRVFDSYGRSSEDTILAAMKKAASLPASIRPDVLSLSLGGPQDAKGPISSMANELMLKENIFMVASAGNSGPTRGSIHAPGNARHILTVTGINKEGKIPTYASRGPIAALDGETWNKPDVAAVAGEGRRLKAEDFDPWGNLPWTVIRGRDGSWSLVLPKESSTVSPHSPVADTPEPADPSYCRYFPGGVVSARASGDSNAGCTLKDFPQYRYMAGTSMAAPMAAGISADLIGYLKKTGSEYKTNQIKALLMETARDLGLPPEVQGAGLLDGERLASTLKKRVEAGLPVGNVAYLFAGALTRLAREELTRTGRYEVTGIGILDRETGHLISNDREFDALLKKLRPAS